jgi:hypothetical protein
VVLSPLQSLEDFFYTLICIFQKQDLQVIAVISVVIITGNIHEWPGIIISLEMYLGKESISFWHQFSMKRR